MTSREFGDKFAVLEIHDPNGGVHTRHRTVVARYIKAGDRLLNIDFCEFAHSDIILAQGAID